MAAEPAFALEWFRGEAKSFLFQMVPNPVGGIVGRTIQFTMRKKLGTNTELLILSSDPDVNDPTLGSISFVNALLGTARISFTSKSTAAMKLDAVDEDNNPVLDELGAQVGIWQADVQFTDAGHEAVPSRGTVTLRHPVRAFPTP